MTSPLTEPHLTGAQLDRAFEECACDLFRQFAATLGGELDESSQGGRHLSFPSHMMFKSAWRTRLTADTADAYIAETIDWFRSRNVDDFGWWTHAGTAPDDLGHRLVAHGFEQLSRKSVLDPNVPSTAQGAPVMAADLSTIDESVLNKVPSGFRIERATSEADLQAFQHIISVGFSTAPQVGAAWSDATRHVGADRTPWRLYLGWLDGEPVATNVVTEGGGIVGVWNIATLAAHRGKGLGAAITVAPLLEARAKGYRYAGLFASALGAPVYERLGFQFTGTRLNRFAWKNV